MKTFSLCHATARVPDGWKKAYHAWRDNCDNWSDVEYVLCVDKLGGDYNRAYDELHDRGPAGIRLTINHGRNCAVDAWNAAGKAATGRFLITAADDMFPPPHWDTELLKVIPDLDGEYAIEVLTGTSPADNEERRCMLHSFITRKYYERIGSNFFDPRFEGMYADDWFTEVARHHGVVVDARHLTFKHMHWIGTTVPYDEIYQRQNAAARYDRGLEIIGELRKAGYPK